MSIHPGGNGHEPHYDLQEPNPDLTPDEVVRIVLDALRHNDKPGPDFGIRTTFNFASPGNRAVTGPLSKFAEMIKNSLYNILIGYQEARIEPAQITGDRASVLVNITGSTGLPAVFVFKLSRQTHPPYRGCWMTDSVMPAE